MSMVEPVVDRAHRNTGQGSAFGGGQVQCKVVNNLTKFRCADFRTPKGSIFSCHLKKLACCQSMFAS